MLMPAAAANRKRVKKYISILTDDTLILVIGLKICWWVGERRVIFAWFFFPTYYSYCILSRFLLQYIFVLGYIVTMAFSRLDAA